jgi:S1-C subfamily serine protease
MDIIEQLSTALAERVAATGQSVVSLRLGSRPRAGILWRPDVVVTSEQVVGDRDTVTVVHAEQEVAAKLAGRDPGTNVAVFRLETPLTGTLPAVGASPQVGSLALMVGANETGGATARLAMVHAVGPAWHSMAGGLIEELIRLDARLGADEGGLVLDQAGELLGMSTAGPRRRVLVIPAATISRVVDPLLEHGHMPRGWLGVGLQSVVVPEGLHQAAGQGRGAMVLNLVADAPAAKAGVMAGDILLAVDGFAFGQNRRLSTVLRPERIGQAVEVRLLRAGEPKTVSVVIGARPGG